MTEPKKHWLVRPKTINFPWFVFFQKDSGLTFFVLPPLMKRTLTISRDVDWVWRRFGSALAREFALHGGKAQRLTGNQVQKRLSQLCRTVFRFHVQISFPLARQGASIHDIARPIAGTPSESLIRRI